MSKRQKMDDAGALVARIVECMQEKKAKDIICLNLKKIDAAVTDYFLICHGTSKTQVDAIGQGVVEKVKQENLTAPYNKEGFENSEWILIDYVDVVVHVFLDSTRNFYQLEDLWADAERLTYNDDES